MSKYGELTTLLKFMQEARTQPAKEEKKNIIEEIVNHFIEDQVRDKMKEMSEKINKKPEKKPEGWDAWSFPKKMAVLTFTVPLCMMTYIAVGLLFVKVCATLMGAHWN